MWPWTKQLHSAVSEQVKVAQLCLTLWDPVIYSLTGFSVHGILQTRILQWVAIPFSRRSSRPRDWAQVSCILGRFLPFQSPGKPPIQLSQLLKHSSHWWLSKSVLPAVMGVKCFIHAGVFKWLSSGSTHEPQERYRTMLTESRCFLTVVQLFPRVLPKQL